MSIPEDNGHSAPPAPCPLCSSLDHDVRSATCAMDSPFAVPGQISRCRRCGMWFKTISPSHSWGQTYGQEYGENSAAGTYMNSPSTRSFFSAALNRVRLPNGAAPPRLLDIGCGSGTMLEEARALGYECEGIELCDHLAEVARQKGFLVHTRDAAELDVQERYDIVTAMDIIEHLPSPLDLLRAVHRSLKPGGEVVVYTPNHRGAVVVLAKLLAALGSDYAFRNIFGGNHLCFFDDRTLPAALQATGFRVRKLWRFPYDPRRPGMPVSLASLCVVRAVEELGRPFGAVFRMVAYAQKEANVSATQP